MIFSLIVLFLMHKGVITRWYEPLWIKLEFGALCEVIAYFTCLHFQSKRDLETNFGRRKRSDIWE